MNFALRQRQPRGDGRALTGGRGDGELAAVEQGALAHAHQPEVALVDQVGRLFRRREAAAVGFSGARVRKMVYAVLTLIS